MWVWIFAAVSVGGQPLIGSTIEQRIEALEQLVRKLQHSNMGPPGIVGMNGQCDCDSVLKCHLQAWQRPHRKAIESELPKNCTSGYVSNDALLCVSRENTPKNKADVVQTWYGLYCDKKNPRLPPNWQEWADEAPNHPMMKI